MEKTAKDILIDNSLNPYELALYRGLVQTKGSKLAKSKALSEAISNVANSEISLDGNSMSVAEAMAVKVIGDVIANPTTSKLKDLATILGDVGTQKVEIVRSEVDEELARMALWESDGDGH